MQIGNSAGEFLGENGATPLEVQRGEPRQFCSAVYSGPEGLQITRWASGEVLAHASSSCYICYTGERHSVSIHIQIQ